MTPQTDQVFSALKGLDCIFDQRFWIEHCAVGHAFVQCFLKPSTGIGIAVREHDRPSLALNGVVGKLLAVGVTTEIKLINRGADRREVVEGLKKRKLSASFFSEEFSARSLSIAIADEA